MAVVYLWLSMVISDNLWLSLANFDYLGLAWAIYVRESKLLLFETIPFFFCITDTSFISIGIGSSIGSGIGIRGENSGPLILLPVERLNVDQLQR